MSILSKYGVSTESVKKEKDERINPVMRFGGLDLAKRTDHSALEILKIKDDKLIEEAFMQWGHVNYGTVAKDLHKFYKMKPMNIIGFDRTGVGDAAIELFDVITLPMEPIIMTNNRKIECVNAVQTMFQTGQLQISSKSPVREQIVMQQVKKSDAGNLIYQHPSGTHDDLFWGLAYAVYVAVPYIAAGGHTPVIHRGSDQLVQHSTDQTFQAFMDNILGSEGGGMSDYDLNRMNRQRFFQQTRKRF
jgi:hypothetical protein